MLTVVSGGGRIQADKDAVFDLRSWASRATAMAQMSPVVWGDGATPTISMAPRR